MALASSEDDNVAARIGCGTVDNNFAARVAAAFKREVLSNPALWSSEEATFAARIGRGTVDNNFAARIGCGIQEGGAEQPCTVELCTSPRPRGAQRKPTSPVSTHSPLWAAAASRCLHLNCQHPPPAVVTLGQQQRVSRWLPRPDPGTGVLGQLRLAASPHHVLP